MGYELLLACARGESHVKTGTPCEDYGLKEELPNIKVFVLSDGHGDKNCPRSNIGSRIACKIAKNELIEFANQLPEFDASCEDENRCSLLDDGKHTQKTLVRQLVTTIIGKWASKVIAHLKEHPLTADERANCAQHYLSFYDNNKRLEHIYGATLIAGLATNRYILLIQQGDGRCEVFWGDGSVTQPIPWDDRCMANVTTSLCDTDAIASTRYHVIDLAKENVIAVLAGSDGVEDTFFSMDGTHNFYRDLLTRAANTSVHDLEDWLIEYLPNFSKNGIDGYGSHDDITICGIIDIDKTRPLIAKMQLDSKIADRRSKIRKTNDRLSSMGSGKLEYLQTKLAEAIAEEIAATKERDSIVMLLEARKSDLETTKEACEAIQLELEAYGLPMPSLSGQIMKALDKNYIQLCEKTIRELESRLPGAERRLADARKRVEPARKELQQFADRMHDLQEYRDAYQQELEMLLAKSMTLDSPNQDLPDESSVGTPTKSIVTEPHSSSETDCENLNQTDIDDHETRLHRDEASDGDSASLPSPEQ